MPSPSDEMPPAPYPTPSPEPTDPAPVDPAPVDPACHPDAVPTLTDYVETGDEMTRVACGGGVAVYADPTVAAFPAEQTEWVQPFLSQMWAYYTTAYGDCSVPRELPVELGPCEDFGAPRPLVLMMSSADPGYAGTINSRFDEAGLNTLWVTNDSWEQEPILRDVISHEACHIVEGSGRGVNGSPAFPVWADSMWAEFCQYDMYVNTGATEDAERVYEKWMESTADYPEGAQGAYWFRDWFYPLWQDGGGTAAVMDRYFQLLSQYFPTSDYAVDFLNYDRNLTTGEYVLFTSAAAGRDLSDRAEQAFNSGFDRAEYEEARSAFPEVAALAASSPAPAG